jgi:thymidine kinase
MSSEKTEELISRTLMVTNSQTKGKIDTRYRTDHITSHSEQSLVAQVVWIDEGQFYKQNIVVVCNHLADQRKRVIVAGFDQDYMENSSESRPQLLAIAEYTTKTLTIYVVCGNLADRIQRIVNQHERVIVGAKRYL